MEITKEREVRVGDVIKEWVNGLLISRTVTKVTAKYVCLNYVSPLTGARDTIKRRRDIVLLGTKYY